MTETLNESSLNVLNNIYTIYPALRLDFHIKYNNIIIILQYNNTVYNLWIWIYHINLSSMIIISLRYLSETIDGCNNFNGEKNRRTNR
jgi:hypothetical protein